MIKNGVGSGGVILLTRSAVLAVLIAKPVVVAAEAKAGVYLMTIGPAGVTTIDGERLPSCGPAVERYLDQLPARIRIEYVLYVRTAQVAGQEWRLFYRDSWASVADPKSPANTSITISFSRVGPDSASGMFSYIEYDRHGKLTCGDARPMTGTYY